MAEPIFVYPDTVWILKISQPVAVVVVGLLLVAPLGRAGIGVYPPIVAVAVDLGEAVTVSIIEDEFGTDQAVEALQIFDLSLEAFDLQVLGEDRAAEQEIGEGREEASFQGILQLRKRQVLDPLV
jgi:hypothetical protein